MSASERRVGANESIFREVNERLEKLGQPAGDTGPQIVCECTDLACGERIEIRLAEYEAIRAHPSRFLVLPGHERPDIERVVGEGDGYFVVEKTGGAAEVAEETDPRTDE
jgi:hypothetical protein